MKAPRVALLAMVLALVADAALACTIIIPPPRPGETLLQAAIRMERTQQRRLRAESSHVYLARVVRDGRRIVFEPVLVIDGSSPPRHVPASNNTNCEPSEPVMGELRIVFARRLSPAEFPWRPWRWGQGALLGSRLPGEVVDLDLASALMKAARND